LVSVFFLKFASSFFNEKHFVLYFGSEGDSKFNSSCSFLMNLAQGSLSKLCLFAGGDEDCEPNLCFLKDF
jgi:hypothetical protein